VIATRRILVDQTGQEGLAGASFAANEHDDVMLRRQRDALDERHKTRSLRRKTAGEGLIERFGASDIDVASWAGQAFIREKGKCPSIRFMVHPVLLGEVP
jgi:hypothetical protein